MIYADYREDLMIESSDFSKKILGNKKNEIENTDLNLITHIAKYGFDKVTVKAQLQTADHEGGDDRSGMTFGADYKLAKNTKLFAFYSSFDMDSEKDQDYLAVGMEYKF